jgi:hypothetical protein
MLDIDRNLNITLTRADTAYIDVTTLKNADGTDYTYEDGDAVYFRLKAISTMEKQLGIDFENNKSTLTLYPEDTVDIPFGIYKYGMELVTALGEHFTFIADKNFTISKELEVHDGN